ncbi:hypothetical protein ACEWY4_017048 [Coilia grayii]|uniref:Alkylated DNA repair protein AlkB homologue 8 N-terminal domain-containing protein n=1 Tax=Coilia grayii TaxID=363190 RepID=A0ABD1JM34_9TELE
MPSGLFAFLTPCHRSPGREQDRPSLSQRNLLALQCHLVAHLVKSAQQRLHFLRMPRKEQLNRGLLVTSYRSTTESLLVTSYRSTTESLLVTFYRYTTGSLLVTFYRSTTQSLLVTFYHSTTESLLTSAVSVWQSSCTEVDRKSAEGDQRSTNNHRLPTAFDNLHLQPQFQ